MKLNKKVAAAINTKKTAKQAKAVKSAKAVKPAAEPQAALAAQMAKARVHQALLLLTGVRGKNVRLVEVHETKDGKVFLKAMQKGDGSVLKDAHFAELAKGIVVGKRDALIELGAYVNGKLTNCAGELLSKTEWHARSKPANVRWNADKDPIHGRYVGDPAVRGMLAVEAQGLFWQVEADSNSHNKHERGGVLPLKKEKLVAVK